MSTHRSVPRPPDDPDYANELIGDHPSIHGLKLADLAKTIRSKNVGTDKITFDIIFREKETYELVKRSKALTPESVCAVLDVDAARLTDFVEYDPAYAIKFTILRVCPNGSAGDADIFGAQQYAPFRDVEVDMTA